SSLEAEKAGIVRYFLASFAIVGNKCLFHATMPKDYFLQLQAIKVIQDICQTQFAHFLKSIFEKMSTFLTDLASLNH
ncbi:7363_t:CDS:2, partial [Gigaspora margarita]